MASKSVPETFEDTAFVTGSSPATHDVNAVLGRNGVDGYIINDGDGNIKVEFSSDGTSYGSKATIKKNEKLVFDGWDIDCIKITWVADSAYRILVI